MKFLRQRLRHRLLQLSGVATRRWNSLPDDLYVFNYHRIGDRKNTSYDPNVFSCNAESFDRQLSMIGREFTLLGLDQLVEIVETGRSPRERLALLTFDDGYMDSYTEALPVLRRHNATGVFFVTSDFVGSAVLPWWDQVAWWLRNASTKNCHVAALDLRLRLQPTERYDQTIKRVLNALKRNPQQLSENLLLLEKALAPHTPLPQDPQLFMGWEQLRELVAAGMFIGSHTQSHRILSQLDAQTLRNELEGPRSLLEQELGTSVQALAYPVGTQGTFNTDSIAAAREAGYSLAFSFLETSNALPLEEPYSIARIGIDGDPTPSELQAKVTQHTRKSYLSKLNP